MQPQVVVELRDAQRRHREHLRYLLHRGALGADGYSFEEKALVVAEQLNHGDVGVFIGRAVADHPVRLVFEQLADEVRVALRLHVDVVDALVGPVLAGGHLVADAPRLFEVEAAQRHLELFKGLVCERRPQHESGADFLEARDEHVERRAAVAHDRLYDVPRGVVHPLQILNHEQPLDVARRLGYALMDQLGYIRVAQIGEGFYIFLLRERDVQRFQKAHNRRERVGLLLLPAGDREAFPAALSEARGYLVYEDRLAYALFAPDHAAERTPLDGAGKEVEHLHYLVVARERVVLAARRRRTYRGPFALAPHQRRNVGEVGLDAEVALYSAREGARRVDGLDFLIRLDVEAHELAVYLFVVGLALG